MVLDFPFNLKLFGSRVQKADSVVFESVSLTIGCNIS